MVVDLLSVSSAEKVLGVGMFRAVGVGTLKMLGV